MQPTPQRACLPSFHQCANAAGGPGSTGEEQTWWPSRPGDVVQSTTKKRIDSAPTLNVKGTETEQVKQESMKAVAVVAEGILHLKSRWEGQTVADGSQTDRLHTG